MRKILLLFLILFFSCSSITNKNSILQILTPVDYSPVGMKLSDIIDTVKYIQLDNSVVLAGLGNVFWTGRNILGTSKSGILMYDSVGRFLRRIGHLGEGPEDYLPFYKMAVDKKDEVIYVFMYPNILLSYSFAGSFLNRIHVQLPESVKDYSPSSIRVQNDLLFFYYSENQGVLNDLPVYWVAIRKDGTMVKCRKGYHDKLKNDEGVIYFTYSTNLDDSTMIYWNLYNDTVFHVGPSVEKAAYLWGKGDFRLLETDSLRNLSEKRMRCSRMVETKSFLLLSWSYMNRKASTFYILYDKRKDISYRLKEDMLYDERTTASLRFNTFDYVRIGEYEYILTQTKSSEVADIPNATPWGIDADDLEGNPVLVLIRLNK